MNNLNNPVFGRRGYVQTFYGMGKGKTVASIGTAFRALGQGWKVLLIMLVKGKDLDDVRFYGEVNTIKDRTQTSEFRVEQFGVDDVLYYGNLTDDIVENLKIGWEFAKQSIMDGQYDLIILDEINVVMDMGVIDNDEIIRTIKRKPSHVEIVCTGRPKIPELIEISDLVTEMRCVKHYYRKNIKARRGIEY